MKFQGSNKFRWLVDPGMRGCICHVSHWAINELHDRLGSAKTFTDYVLALKAIDVERYESCLVDGHSEYFGQGGHSVVSPAVHEVLARAETGQRETSYLEMSRGLAQSGRETQAEEIE